MTSSSLAPKEFDGFWRITYNYDADKIQLPTGQSLFPLSEAYVVIANGRFGGCDVGGCTCSGFGVVNPDGTVTYQSVWDASRAEPNVYLPTPNGPTKGAVQLTTTLQVVRHGSKLTAYGVFPLGPLQIDVHAERLRGLNE